MVPASHSLSLELSGISMQRLIEIKYIRLKMHVISIIENFFQTWGDSKRTALLLQFLIIKAPPETVLISIGSITELDFP